MVLDEHYNNVKVLDDAESRVIPIANGWQGYGVRLECLPLQTPTNTGSVLPSPLSPRLCSGTEEGSLFGGLPKQLKVMVDYLKVGPQVRTYSDYLRAAREAEKEDLIELTQSSRVQTADSLPKPRTTSFFPLRKLKGNQQFSRKPSIWLVQLEEEDTDDGEDPHSDDPDGIKGVMEEFMVQLARAVKDAQTDEKHCYHCSSPKHFVHNCLLMKTARDKKQLNRKERTAMMKGAQTPPTTTSAIKSPQKEAQEA